MFRLVVSSSIPQRLLSSHLNRLPRPLVSSGPVTTTTVRFFESERAYHPVADATLESIQDALDEYCEEIPTAEVTLASGVLTIQLPPHGTWVINKQTPNRQIWWSSPLSGPKRFEHDSGLWYATKDGLNLGSSLAEELQHVYPDLGKLDLRV